MKYILHSVRMLWKSALQYRSSLVMQIIAQIIMTSGELLAVTVILDRFKMVGQWQAPEILFFFGVMHASFALTELFGRGIAAFQGFVQSGRFDALLLRPRPLLMQVMLSQIDLRRAGSFLVGAAAVVSASMMLGVEWTLAKAALLVWCIFCSVLLCLGLFMIEATVVFFSVRSIEMVNVLTYGGRSTCEYPVDIYPKPLRFLFTYLAPLAMCLHWPVSWIIGKPMVTLPDGAFFLTPIAGALFFMLMAGIWYRGVKHYRSTGT